MAEAAHHHGRVRHQTGRRSSSRRPTTSAPRGKRTPRGTTTGGGAGRHHRSEPRRLPTTGEGGRRQGGGPRLQSPHDRRRRRKRAQGREPGQVLFPLILLKDKPATIRKVVTVVTNTRLTCRKKEVRNGEKAEDQVDHEDDIEKSTGPQFELMECEGTDEKPGGLASSDRLLTAFGLAESAAYIPLEIDGTKVMALVNTGASVNLICASLVREELITPIQATLRMPTTRQTVRPLGFTAVTPHLAGVPVRLQALVVDDLGEKVLMGRTFMRDYEVVTDWKRRAISFGVDRRHTIFWEAEGMTRSGALTADEL